MGEYSRTCWSSFNQYSHIPVVLQDGFVHLNQNRRHVEGAAHRLSVLFTEFLAKVDEEFGFLSVAALGAHVAKMV